MTQTRNQKGAVKFIWELLVEGALGLESTLEMLCVSGSAL